MFDALVLGAGPAGLTAGIYLGRAKKSVLILDTGTVGGAPIMTHQVSNYPGIPDVPGYSLAFAMKKQAESFGCKIKGNAVIAGVSLDTPVKRLTLADGTEYEGKTLIIATGGTPRKLGIPKEEVFKGKGISYCATCDGDFFTDKEIVVIGGGNSALEEAVSLSKYASKITILHEFDHFQAFQAAVDEAKANPKLHYVMNVRVLEFIGDSRITGVAYERKETGERGVVEAAGAFVFIGYVPSSKLFEGMLDINDRGEIVADESTQTSLPGVYAAGDIRTKRIRQLTTAVADGTVAALYAIHHMESQPA
ncbi:FAD-dependent oxidoreductase [Myxococcota bacterium]|nr:FAD-dependent oxidoreductase [Myxococcota bacterium]MBU1535243.1 FAD-dependent oxidoreductase [Myxococcota bacterium]